MAQGNGETHLPLLRPEGWRKYGKSGWWVGSAKKARGTPWEIHVSLIERTFTSFWRVGLCVERDRLTEVAHLRYETEDEAIEAVTWLVAVAKETA